MDSVELLTLLRTSVDDEIEFLEFAMRNPKVKLLRAKATLSEPSQINIDEFKKIKVSGSPADCQLYLWNSGIPHRLRWAPTITRYDPTWSPIDDEFGGTPMRLPRNRDEFEAFHYAFRRQPITGRMFRYGKYLEQYCPIIPFYVFSEKTKDRTGAAFRIWAQFSNWLNKDVWICWNGILQKWEHEIEDVDDWSDNPCEQPATFIEWQTSIFDWLKRTHPKKILPEQSYRK